jgi:predicted MFS family arabinose efflux permease
VREAASGDLRLIYLLQALRAFAYGFASVILGASLAHSGLSGSQVGLVFASLLAGSAIASLGLARRADRLGRRRVYATLFVLMAIAGTVFAQTDSLLLLILAGLTGTLSVEVVESGPFTSVEQAMIPEVAGARTTSAFGTYNAYASLLGAGGALLAGGPDALRGSFPSLPADQRWLLVYPVIGVVAMVMVGGLSSRVEAKDGAASTGRLATSRRPVVILAGLFGLDSFAGGFIVQSFLVFWFTKRFGASTGLMGVVLAATGVIQAASFVAAPRIAARWGLLNTMVFTHLPSNVILALIPLAPNLGVALGLLLFRFPLSQMDVPARQAYLAALAGPERAGGGRVDHERRVHGRAPVRGAAGGRGRRVADPRPPVLHRGWPEVSLRRRGLPLVPPDPDRIGEGTSTTEGQVPSAKYFGERLMLGSTSAIPSGAPSAIAGAGHLALACENMSALASNRCPRSSRICPANDRETSRNDGNGWSNESAGQGMDSGIAAGSEIGLENTLKVWSLQETRRG